MIETENSIGLLSLEYHIDICDTSSGYLSKGHNTTISIILDLPVLCLSLLNENTNPVIRLMLIHKEGMNTIAILSWCSTIFDCVWSIESPHGISAIIIEELVLRSLTKTHNSFEFISLLSESMHSDPVQI